MKKIETDKVYHILSWNKKKKKITLSINDKISTTMNTDKQPRKDNPKVDF